MNVISDTKVYGVTSTQYLRVRPEETTLLCSAGYRHVFADAAAKRPCLVPSRGTVRKPFELRPLPLCIFRRFVVPVKRYERAVVDHRHRQLVRMGGLISGPGRALRVLGASRLAQRPLGGGYFCLEALMRFKTVWNPYW